MEGFTFFFCNITAQFLELQHICRTFWQLANIRVVFPTSHNSVYVLAYHKRLLRLFVLGVAKKTNSKSCNSSTYYKKIHLTMISVLLYWSCIPEWPHARIPRTTI